MNSKSIAYLTVLLLASSGLQSQTVSAPPTVANAQTISLTLADALTRAKANSPHSRRR